MDNFSSGESSKPCSPQKAALFEDLKNARQSNAQYLDMIRQMEARLQSLEIAREDVHQNRERRHHHHRHSSRTSHSSHGYHEGNERRRHHHHEERRQHVAGPYSPIVKLPIFSESDPNVYLR